MTGTRGSGVIELLVSLLLVTGVLSALAAAVGGGRRLADTLGRRSEAEDTAQIAAEALLFDVRRAGFDPRGAGFEALVEADATHAMLDTDVDADGTIDATSEERTTYLCNRPARRLSRILGLQSMPLADGVAACALGYRGADGTPLAIPPGGLDAAQRARVRTITVDVVLSAPGLSRSTARSFEAALRTAP